MRDAALEHLVTSCSFFFVVDDLSASFFLFPSMALAGRCGDFFVADAAVEVELSLSKARSVTADEFERRSNGDGIVDRDALVKSERSSIAEVVDVTEERTDRLGDDDSTDWRGEFVVGHGVRLRRDGVSVLDDG